MWPWSKIKTLEVQLKAANQHISEMSDKLWRGSLDLSKAKSHLQEVEAENNALRARYSQLKADQKAQKMAADEAYDELNARHQEVKEQLIHRVLDTERLEKQLAAFSKFDHDKDGKPGGSKPKTKAAPVKG